MSDRDGLLRTLLFVAAGMLTLLVHEFGHALVGRAVSGGSPSIIIAGMGGLTYNPVPPRSRAGYLALVAAGPLASLLLGLVVGLLFGILIGAPLAGLASAWLVPLPWAIPGTEGLVAELSAGLAAHPLSPYAVTLVVLLMEVSFWWSIFNLFPIFPLDGGKLLAAVLHNEFVTCLIGFGLSLALAVYSLVIGVWFNVMLAGYFAYINFQYLRELRRNRA